MAAIKPVISNAGKADGACLVVAWLAVTENDTCVPYQGGNLSDKSIHVTGAFGGSSTAVFGSNNQFATTGAALRDPSSTTIAITAETIKQVLENVDMIKPLVTGGSSQNLNIYMLVNQNNPLRQ